MKNFTRLVVVSLLILVLVAPVMAQDTPGAGEGGIIVLDNTGDMATRAIEPLVGMGRGLPMWINLSPRVVIGLEAGAMYFTS